MAGRQSVRLLARQLTSSQHHAQRAFSSTRSALAAQNFTMPAMSPTMTEGNISSWKVKEGDSFSTGDVLLEIETDKASMDVEAQDDGVMAKIFHGDGAKGVRVGTRIAVIGEAGDDPSSLEIPADGSKPVESEKENIKKGDDSSYESSGAEKETPGTPQNPRAAKDKPKSSPQGPGANPKYPLYPSVVALIHENHISDSDVAKIAATGPNGRLLKGDVLAYLGTIESDYSANQSKRIEHMGHLDLRNIKILTTPPAKPAPSSSVDDAAQALPPVTSITLTVSLAEVLKVQKRIKDTLGVTVPISTFLARAVDLANDDLPQLKNAKPTADQLFHAVLGLDSIPTESRGTYLPQIDAFPPPLSPRGPILSRSPKLASTTTTKIDIIDILSGKVQPRRAAFPKSLSSTIPGRTLTTSDGAFNLFSLTVPKAEEKRARTFLERVKTVLQVEPGKLVL